MVTDVIVITIDCEINIIIVILQSLQEGIFKLIDPLNAGSDIPPCITGI
jgi:hypothetical protein